MSISDIINPWGALRDARWTIDAQTRELTALYSRLGQCERTAVTNGLLIRVLRAKIERLEK